MLRFYYGRVYLTFSITIYIYIYIPILNLCLTSLLFKPRKITSNQYYCTSFSILVFLLRGWGYYFLFFSIFIEGVGRGYYFTFFLCFSLVFHHMLFLLVSMTFCFCRFCSVMFVAIVSVVLV